MNFSKLFGGYKLFFVLIFISFNGFAQSNSDMNGGFFQIGINYFQPERPGLQNYLNAFSDTFHFPKKFNLPWGKGIYLGFVSHKNAFEFTAGGDLLFGSQIQISDSGSGKLSTTDINLNFGVNYLPVQFFYIGASSMICNGAEKFKAADNFDPTRLENQESSLKGIFNGYYIAGKAQAGFNINVSRADHYEYYLRLSAFYQLGITEYDFYKTFEKRLTGYSGNHKTMANYPGIVVAMLFGG